MAAVPDAPSNGVGAITPIKLGEHGAVNGQCQVRTDDGSVWVMAAGDSFAGHDWLIRVDKDGAVASYSIEHWSVGSIGNPQCMVATSDANLWYPVKERGGDGKNLGLVRFDTRSHTEGFFKMDLGWPVAIAVSPDDHLWMAEENQARIDVGHC